MKRLNVILIFFVVSSMILSCSKTTPPAANPPVITQFGIFKVLDDKLTIEMEGEINNASLNNFNALENAFPSVSKIIIINCFGSLDDEVNLQLSKKVYDKSMEIHIADNGTIASGGVDFFIAGAKRTKGVNTRIGVHSWAGGDMTATDYPVGHIYHLDYINYYVSVGFTQKQAEDFYYFTINAAPAEDIHFMTEEEIKKYNLLTE